MEKAYAGKDGKVYPDRRKFPRLKQGVKVRYMIPLEFFGVKWETKAKDIGPMGIRIEREEELEQGTLLALELELPPSEEKPELVRTMARVVWCQKLRGEKEYSVGLEFVRHDKDMLERITQFVSEHLDK